jgi:predicted outer membrane repeat protein
MKHALAAILLVSNIGVGDVPPLQPSQPDSPAPPMIEAAAPPINSDSTNDTNGPSEVNVTRTYPGSAPCNTTLQACISASADGDTVNISPGTYLTDSLLITRAVNLNGNSANPAAVKLRPSSGRMFEINAPTIITTPIAFTGLTIENGNNPIASGGAVRVQTSSGVPLFRNMVISNSVGLGGGAIRIVSSLPVTITGSIFYSNTSNGDGGAISSNGPVNLIDSVVQANRANNSGGGIEADGAVVISNSQVLSNTAVISGGGITARNAVTITDSAIATNTAQFGGGLLSLSNQTVLISGAVQFRSNQATDVGAPGGGGVLAYGDVHLAGGLSSAGRTLFRNNYALAGGGGISSLGDVYFTRGFPQTVYIEFDGNFSLASDGGAIRAFGEVRWLVSSVKLRMTNNSAHNGGAVWAGTRADLFLDPLDSFATLQNNTATAGDGGAISSDFDVTLRGGNAIRNNSADRHGGLIYSGEDANLVVVETDPVGPRNRAAQDGGCVYGVRSVTVNNGELAFCDADRNGGAAFSLGWVRTFNNASIFDNTAQRGGGLYATTYLTVEDNSTLHFNNAITEGGGAFAQQFVYIANSTWLTNTAGTRGGAAVLGSGQVLSSQFQFNRVNQLGGVFYTTGTSSLDVTASTFANNTAPASGQAGAIAHAGTGELRLLRSQFLQNTAGDAGALLCNGPCTIQQSTLADNRAIRLDALTSSSIGKGGAVLSNNTLVVKRSAFVRNRAGSPGGGGIYANAGSLDVENTLFANNLIENNAAFPLSGSAAYVTGTGNSRLAFNTFVNTAFNSVSAVALGPTTPVVNNIFSSYGVGIEQLPAGVGDVFEHFNLWHNVSLTSTAGVQHGLTAIIGDPLFINPAAGDFHVQAGSPAVNAGTDVSVAIDFDGDVRPSGAAPDIGFDEVNAGAPTPTPTITPSETPPTPPTTPTPTLPASLQPKAYLPIVQR